MVQIPFDDIVKKVKGTFIEHAAEATKHMDGLTTQQKTMYFTGKKAMAGAGMFIAGTAILDTSMKKMDKMEAQAQNKQLEKNLEKKSEEEKRKREEYRHGISFGHVDAGQIVMDMFNERTGHHKMGNSRF